LPLSIIKANITIQVTVVDIVEGTRAVGVALEETAVLRRWSRREGHAGRGELP
jgi:hypothetical protein